jgi:hypothetical protein
VHYLDKHQVRLPARFVDHVRSALEQLEESVVDEGWWKSQTGGASEASSR